MSQSPVDTPSAPLPSRCNCGALRRASRRLSQMYDAMLAPSGLKSTQYALLDEIGRRNDAPPTIRDLADAMVMDQSTIGQNLRPLQRDGLVALAQDDQDRRRRYVKLTRKGRARLRRGQPLWREVQAVFENELGAEQAAELRAVLSGIAHRPAFMAGASAAS
jgi:DNA-binding MarR family transcriptional regulator